MTSLAITPLPSTKAAAPGRDSLTRNVRSLYALQIANYLIPLLTLPFLVRQLGPNNYGRLAFAYALSYFLVLFVDAGFNTRAARALATSADCRRSVDRIYAATQWIRLVTTLLSLLLLVLLIATIPAMRPDAAIYLASFMTVLGSLLFPVWLFQGLEIMRYTTRCSVAGRVLVTLAILTLVRGPEDTVLAAALQCSGTAVSGLLAMPIIFGHLKLTLFPPALGDEIRRTLRSCRGLVVSEYLSNALNNSATFVLGLFHSAALVGSFAAVEKLGRAGASGFNPLFQALLPRLSAQWQLDSVAARTQAKRRSLGIAAVAFVASACVYSAAEALLQLVFGPAWAEHADLLRCFAIWFLFSTGNAIAGQFWLLAAGHQATYAHCLMFGGVLQALLLVPAACFAGTHGAAMALALAEALTALFVWRAVWTKHYGSQQ